MRSRTIVFALFSTLVAATFLVCTLSSVQAQKKVDFSTEIQPIFQKSCASCHGLKSQMGQLRLDARSAAMIGGQSGKIIHPGSAKDSILYQRVAGLGDQARMPMGGKLSQDQIEAIRLWVEQGAEWPESAASTESAAIKKH
ncbi:MAG: c-type cytochrome, partial [Bryobacteraceae bacterium]|nr:c-type cytochrome [Bryobacteraceae bacterium]